MYFILQLNLKSMIPLKFPNQLEKLIKSGVDLTEKQKAYIIRETCRNLFAATNFNTQKHQINEVAVLLCNQYEFLKGPYGSGHVSICSKYQNVILIL